MQLSPFTPIKPRPYLLRPTLFSLPCRGVGFTSARASAGKELGQLLGVRFAEIGHARGEVARRRCRATPDAARAR